MKHLACALISLILVSCGKPSAGAGAGPPPIPVVAVRAATQAISDRVSATGNLEANEAVQLKSEVEGTIDEIGFSEGEHVEKETVLFRIDPGKLDAALAQAEANLKLAEANLARSRSLEETRAISKQELDQAVSSFEAARAAGELARAQLRDATISAPFSGMMGARRVSPGQFVTKGESLSFLIDNDPMKAELRVPERFLAELRTGQRVDLQVSAYPREKFAGEVYFIDPRVDESTRTVLVKARVPNPDGKLQQGMFATLNLVTQVREDAVVIPETAVVFEGNRTSIYVVDEENAADPRPVETGLRLEGLVEIARGVEAGELVVIEGTQKLRPGANARNARGSRKAARGAGGSLPALPLRRAIGRGIQHAKMGTALADVERPLRAARAPRVPACLGAVSAKSFRHGLCNRLV